MANDALLNLLRTMELKANNQAELNIQRTLHVIAEDPASSERDRNDAETLLRQIKYYTFRYYNLHTPYAIKDQAKKKISELTKCSQKRFPSYFDMSVELDFTSSLKLDPPEEPQRSSETEFQEEILSRLQRAFQRMDEIQKTAQELDLPPDEKKALLRSIEKDFCYARAQARWILMKIGRKDNER